MVTDLAEEPVYEDDFESYEDDFEDFTEDEEETEEEKYAEATSMNIRNANIAVDNQNASASPPKEEVYYSSRSNDSSSNSMKSMINILCKGIDICYVHSITYI